MTPKQQGAKPQSFYFNMTQHTDNIELVEKVTMYQAQARELDIYHQIVDALCLTEGFRYKRQEDGSTPKYVALNGNYLYAADNYFHEDLKIYHCSVELSFFHKQPSGLVFHFFDEKGEILPRKTLTVDMDEITSNGNFEKTLGLIVDKVNDMCVAMDAECHTQSWTGEPFGSPATAFPENMTFNSRILEDVIVPDLVRDEQGLPYTGITDACVSSAYGYGREAMLNISFLSDTGLHERPVGIQPYIEKSLKAGCYTNPKEYRFDTEKPMMSWQAMYGSNDVDSKS